MSGEGEDSRSQDAFVRLRQVVARLRAPDGCPWDRQQTVGSVKRYLLVEAYEALDALAASPEEACEELGDLLFQVAFLAELYHEQGAFGLSEVAERAADKMIARHPHVFAGEVVSGAEEVIGRWAELKARARGERPGERSLLAGVPRALPALERAFELSERAARSGFDWPDAAAVLAKLDEERAELQAAIAVGGRDHLLEELGDLLFVLANLARKLGVNPEEALQATNAKFIRRFQFVELGLAERGPDEKAATLAEMDELWEEAKRRGL